MKNLSIFFIMSLYCFFVHADTRDTRTIVIDIDTTLTACCATIQQDFDNTFTILSTFGLCNATVIEQGITITSPGFYCLGTDINSTITIAANDVTLDLNGHQISGGLGQGIVIANHSNILIKNGFIANCSNGIETNTVNGLTITNLEINNCFLGMFLTVTNGLTLKDVDFNFITGLALQFNTTSNHFNIEMINSRINNCHFGINAQRLVNSYFENVVVSGGGDSLSAQRAFFFNICTSTILKNCHVQNFTGQFGFLIANSAIVLLDECSVQNLIGSTGDVSAFDMQNTTFNILRDCSAIGVTAPATFRADGFLFLGNNAIVINCLAKQISGNNTGVGFRTQNDNNIFLNCEAYQVTNSVPASICAGIALLNNHAIIDLCQASYNGKSGFYFDTTGGTEHLLAEDCAAFRNTTTGFEVVGTVTIVAVSNFSSENTTNYTPGLVPNVQGAAVTTNVFARGNNF